MAGVFDNKHFNAEVFTRYMDTIPNPRKTELLKSRAIVSRPELATAMREQVGGNILSSPIRGNIFGETPLNYDGATDITATSTETYLHTRVVVGRAKAWSEKDFSYDITGGEDFMEVIASQINEYWNEVDQDTIVSILKGIFSMNDTEGKKFVDSHTHDITGVTNSEGKTGLMDATSLNNAMQKASGDQKSKFSLVLMHSVVATNLENLKILVYLKYNDADGIERELGLAQWNGRLVLVDDSMPSEEVSEGETTSTVYTTYVLGDGAIEYTDCGAKVPYEASRNPSKDGGEDLLYSRQRKCWAPYGISFTQKNMASASPTNAELEKGANWELVHTAGSSKKYIDQKMIPIAQIKSLG